MESLFEEVMVKAFIKKANLQSVAGPSRPRYSYLQVAPCDELVEDLAAFATLVFLSRVLPHVFWTLHTSANLSALRGNMRPMACGDVLRRVIGAVFCRRYDRKSTDYFQPWGQYGVAESGGVDINALTATLGFGESCTPLSYDGAKAFNSMHRQRFRPDVEEIDPSVLFPYVANLYARKPPKALFALYDEWLEEFESARGVHQGCNLGPLFYTSHSLKILKELGDNPPVPGARTVLLIDGITGILPPEISPEMAAIVTVTEWLQECQGVEGISVNRRKLQTLLANRIGPEYIMDERRKSTESAGLTVVQQGIETMGVLGRTEQCNGGFLQEAVNGEPAELVRVLVPMEEAQASYQILRLSSGSRLSHLLCTVQPSITHQASPDYDALMEWALAPIIASDGAAAAGLRIPEEEVHGPRMCQTKTFLGQKLSAAGPPLHPRKRSLTHQHQLYQRHGLRPLSRLDLGTSRYGLRPGQPSIPPRTAA